MRTLIHSIAAGIVFAAADSASGPASGNADQANQDTPTTTTTTGNADSGATSATATLISIITDPKQIESIKDFIPDRKTFATPEEAVAALTDAAGKTSNFFGLPVAIAGMNPDNTLNTDAYKGALATLATVGARVKDAKGKALIGIRGIVMFPIPTVETFLAAGESGANFVAKVIEKEAALMAFRPLRDPATHEAFIRAVGEVPTTVDNYLTENARTGGGGDATFDALWKDLRDSLKVNYDALVRQLPTKAEVVKCIRSASYANETQPALESRGIFVKLANMVIKGAAKAQPTPLDTTGISDWLAGRDTLNLGTGKPTADDLAALDALDF
jgi:hypothetical protein